MVFQCFQRRAKSLARGLQDVPRRFKRPPRRSKTLQDAPRRLQDGSKTPPRRLQDAPRGLQDAPRRLQDASKCLPDASKMFPRRARLPKAAKSSKHKENQWFSTFFSVGPARFREVFNTNKAGFNTKHGLCWCIFVVVMHFRCLRPFLSDVGNAYLTTNGARASKIGPRGRRRVFKTLQDAPRGPKRPPRAPKCPKTKENQWFSNVFSVGPTRL
jgi:hypothetical protein